MSIYYFFQVTTTGRMVLYLELYTITIMS